jgi:tight adherence protein B
VWDLTPFAAAVAVLALVGYLMLLRHDRRHRRLRDRVAGVAARQQQDEAAAAPVRAPVARRSQRRRQRLFSLASIVLCFNPDVKALNIIPWRLVFAIGSVIGVAAMWALSLWLRSGPDDVRGTAMSFGGGVAVALFAIRTIFNWERNRYRKALFRQLPDTVDLTVSSTLAGLPVSEAFRNIADGMSSPTREEFGIVVGDIAIGTSVETALLRLHDRTRVSEYAIFAMVISVQSQGGGRLTESLQHLAEMVRQRVSIGQRAFALAGEARMSALILILLPFFAGGLLTFINPGYLDPLFADPRGVRLFMFAVISLIVGALTMRALIQWAVGGR